MEDMYLNLNGSDCRARARLGLEKVGWPPFSGAL